MERGYRISFDGSKGYSIVIYKKEHKCITCGNLSKSGNSRSHEKGNFNNFICSNCLKLFIHQYSNFAKMMSFNMFLKKKISWKQKLDKAPNIKCRLCGKIIQVTYWRNHLTSVHQIKDVRLRDFFIGENADLNKARENWYNPNIKIPNGKLYCGSKFNGTPEAKIIYNAVDTNRRKH